MGHNLIKTKDGRVLLDLTKDSITPETLLKGTTAHDKHGEEIVGTFVEKPGIVNVTIKEVTNG